MDVSFSHKNKLGEKRQAKRENGPFAKEFWSSIPKGAIARVYKAYRPDFKMFGYTLQDYFSGLGLYKLAYEINKITDLD